MLRTLINPGSGAYCSWMSICIDNVFPNIPGKHQHLLYEHLCQILNVTKANYVICYVMYYTTEKQPLEDLTLLERGSEIKKKKKKKKKVNWC